MSRPGIHGQGALRAGVLLALLAGAVALAGCGGGGHGATTGGASSAGTSTAPSGGNVSTAAPPGTTGSTTAASTGAGSPAAARDCATSGLAVWLGLGQGGAAAGSTFYPLEFTNVSHSACRLFGFPGVSARNAHQLGSPAARDHSRPAQAVTLDPGATAHTVIQILNAFNFPQSKCKPVTAHTIRVYPPNQRAATEIPFGFPACSVRGEIFLSVQPIRPGVGVPGYPDV